jgi:cytochrome d ubiquinol oxidase subunit I
VVGVRTAFQVMVGAGSALALAAIAVIVATLRRAAAARRAASRRPRLPDGRRWLWAFVVLGPLGFVSLEAGWLVTEWGRQPWIVRGLMRTAEAVTDFPYKAAPFWLFTVVYLFLGAAVIFLLARQIARADRPHEPSGSAHGA